MNKLVKHVCTFLAPTLAALAVAAAQASPITPYVSVRAGPCPTCQYGYDYGSDVADVSGSAQGDNPSSTIAWSARADAANVGEMRLRGSAALQGRGQANVWSDIHVSDGWNLSRSDLDGQAGRLTATIFVDGRTFADNNYRDPFLAGARARWELTYSDGRGRGAGQYLALTIDHTKFRADSESNLCWFNDAWVDDRACYGAITFDVDFVWGVELPWDVWFRAFADAVGDRDDVVASAGYELANSVYWGGFSNVRANGNLVADYDFDSASGFDWRVSRIPNGSVPEPSSAALALLGLVFAVSRARHRSDMRR